jgi:hypothetical protein
MIMSSNDLTIGIIMPLASYGIDMKPIIGKGLKRLGISAKVDGFGLYLVTFKNKNDLHLLLISGKIAISEIKDSKTYWWIDK